MIQNINNNNAVSYFNNIPQVGKNANNNSANAQADSTDNTQFSARSDTYINRFQESINPDDAQYLGVVVSADGKTVNYPADFAPLAAKKAWNGAVNKLASEEKPVKTEVFVYDQTQRFHKILISHYTFRSAQNFLSPVSRTFSIDL